MMRRVHAQPVVPAVVIGRSFQIFREHFAVLFPVALIFALVQAMVTFATQDSDAAAIAAGVSLVTATFFQGMVTGFVRDVEAGLPAGTEPSVGALFRAVAPVAGPLLLVSIIAGLLVGLGFLLLIVPGLLLLTMWAVVAPVVVLERTGVVATFGRSRALVRGNSWPVFWTLIQLFLLVLVAGVVAVLATAGLGDVAGSFVQVLTGAVAATLLALGTATLYFRLLEAEATPPAPTVVDDDPHWTEQP